MKPASLDYRRAESLDHACELLGSCGGDAKILAGGQSLIAAMNFRLARPRVLIDISHIGAECQVIDLPAGIRVAAGATQRMAERDAKLREGLPVLANAIEHIAHLQIRNKGTVCGSIANADPASELPALSLLLDAEIEIKSAGDARLMAAEDFFVTYMTTALSDDELIAAVTFRRPPPGSGWGFHEVARRAGDFALAGSTAVVALDADGKCSHARIALFGVAATPVRATAAEGLLLGEVCSELLIDHASAAIDDVLDPESDVHVTEAYRRKVARVITARALRDAFGRATRAAA